MNRNRSANLGILRVVSVALVAAAAFALTSCIGDGLDAAPFVSTAAGVEIAIALASPAGDQPPRTTHSGPSAPSAHRQRASR